MAPRASCLAISRLLCVITVALLTLTGCSPRSAYTPAKVRVRQGGGQYGHLGSTCHAPLLVEVLGPVKRGILGGKGRAAPCPGVRVVLEPCDPVSGPEVLGGPELVTDEGGLVSARIKLGNQVGDHDLRVRLPDHPKLTTTVRFTAGLSVSGVRQETLAGETLPEPIVVRVQAADGGPAAGVPVHFRLTAVPGKKAALSTSRALTDAAGEAEVQLRTDPSATGRYDVTVEVSDPDRQVHIRGVVVPALAINRLGLIFGILGGLGIFIYGMQLMSSGLQQIAGPRLRNVLQFMARNRFVGVLAGTGITALIQSSSACTVMVVGFVNAGLLNLQQAIGIVFGAAIGTTVTGQMVSFKLDCLALPAVGIGVAMLLLCRRSILRNSAQTILGFGLLFLGMTMMSSQLKGLAQFPSFIEFFHIFDCRPGRAGGMMPVGAVLGALTIGTVMTMVVQSSSATIGLTIALATSGLVNFYTAIPLILGDNIGTTITALLASLGTNRTAKQTAIAHTVFKAVGAIYMIVLFYIPYKGNPVFLTIVDAITAGDVFAETPENIGRHVAAAHTLFNLINVAVFLPLVVPLAWLCRRLLPSNDALHQEVEVLEPHLLNTPAIALGQTQARLMDMTRDASEITDLAWSVIRTPDEDLSAEIRQRETQLDDMQRDVIHYLVRITQRALSEEQSEAVPLLMHCANDAERIGDHAMNLLGLARQLREEEETISPEALVQLGGIVDMLRSQAEKVLAVFDAEADRDPVKAVRLEGKIKQQVLQCETDHEERLKQQSCTVGAGVVFVEVLTNLERIASHYGNIAERIAKIPSPAGD